MRRYVDIHCHPSTKPYIKFASGLNANGKPTLWDEIKYDLILGIDEWMINDILDSQSSLKQMSFEESSYSLAINAIIPMERELAKYTQFPLAMKLMLPFRKQISKSYFESLQSMETNYANRLEEELAFSAETKNVHLITNTESTLNPKKLNLVLAIEGGHALYDNPKFENSTIEVVDRLKTIREHYRILYLTVTHLAPCPLSNHCFGMKNVSKKHIPRFYPKDEIGISQVGLRVIDHCLDDPSPTCIDIKHMSLAARLQFYEYRKVKGYKVPIIASHNAATGYKIDKWKESMIASASDWERSVIDTKPYFGIKVERPVGITLRNVETVFNPATINLFDEDIEEIILSDGLIGVSFDERILGRGTKSKFFEVLAEKELRHLLAIQFDKTIVVNEVSNKKFNTDVNYYDVKMKRPTLRFKDINKRKLKVANTFNQTVADALFFLNNLLYMVKVAKATIDNHHLEKDPWQFFSLGSDFDGVIDAIDACANAKKMKGFEDLLKQLCIEYLGKNQSFEQYGINSEDAFKQVNQKFDMLCYENAINFTQRLLNMGSN